MMLKARLVKDGDDFLIEVEENDPMKLEILGNILKRNGEFQTDCQLRTKNFLEPLDWETIEKVKGLERKVDRLMDYLGMKTENIL